MKKAALTAKRWYTFQDRLSVTPPVVYATTAIHFESLSPIDKDNSKDPEAAPLSPSQLGKRHKAMGGQPLPRNTHCHEYLALDIQKANLKERKEQDNRKTSRRFFMLNYRAYLNHGFLPATFVYPSFMLYPSFWFSMFIAGPVKAFVTFGPIILGGTYLILFFMDGFFEVLKGILFMAKEPDLFFWGYLCLYPLDKIFDYVQKNDWHRLFDPKTMPVFNAIKRDTGMIRLFNNQKEWADIPFSEIDGFNSLVPMGRGQQTRKLTLRHRRTGCGFLLGEGGVDGWHPALLWEYYQHYMDVSRPLPDVPFFEPYRHLDPTTKKWDEEHERPARYWRDMSDETYEALVLESIKAAKTYPYMQSEKVAKDGWQPAGDGKHWYQLG